MPALCIYVQTVRHLSGAGALLCRYVQIVRHVRHEACHIDMCLSCAMNLTFQYIPQRGNRYYIPQRVRAAIFIRKGYDKHPSGLAVAHPAPLTAKG